MMDLSQLMELLKMEEDELKKMLDVVNRELSSRQGRISILRELVEKLREEKDDD